MVTVYLSLGSNLGDKIGYLTEAIKYIKKLAGVNVERVSSFYLTQPWQMNSDNNFINCIVEVKTVLEPEELHSELKNIEIKVGRKDFGLNRDREIDIDIIFYGNRIINRKDLVIPHPRMHSRMFVLQPLLELAADFEHPVLKRSVRELVALTEDTLRVTKLNNITID